MVVLYVTLRGTVVKVDAKEMAFKTMSAVMSQLNFYRCVTTWNCTHAKRYSCDRKDILHSAPVHWKRVPRVRAQI
jgi:hypothetical protein